MRLRQPTIEDLLVAPTREGDPSTSFEAAGRVRVKEKQRLTLEALLELRRHNAAPVEAWRVHRKAQRIHVVALTQAMGIELLVMHVIGCQHSLPPSAVLWRRALALYARTTAGSYLTARPSL